MVASAFPLAQVAQKAAEERAAADARAQQGSEGDLPSVDDLPFSAGDSHLPPTPSSATGTTAADGASSRPGDASFASQSRASASGSVLLSQIMGAADIMGIKDLEVPDLPTAQLDASHPLRAAIVTWIATTGAVVPADELAVQLLRADAMPLDVQRDVALLLLSASEATTLQRAALAALSPAEQQWIYTHPEIAQQMIEGVETPETQLMALMASKVDMRSSVLASLLLLKAVETTRGSLSEHEAQAAIKSLDSADLDPTTRSILTLLASAQTHVSDHDKVMLAAQLVSLSSGVELPASSTAPSFEQALTSLMSASHQAPDAAALASVLDRAAALPLDLQGAIAGLIAAEALAIQAADPAHMTPTSQPQALGAMLVAVADALPVLEKYDLYWRDAPDAVRVGEWDPATRLGWAAHHAALFATSGHDISDLAAAAAVLNGHELPAGAIVPERSFLDAYVAVLAEAGIQLDADKLAKVQQAADTLDPAVRDAAAIMMSGAAESARLQREAFADLSPEEQRFLRHDAQGLDALYTATSLSQSDLARLARASALSERVDADKLAQAGVVGALATSQAKRLLEGRDAFATQSAVTHVATGLRGLFARFLPVQAASAQGGLTEDCVPTLDLIESCTTDDVQLRLFYPTLLTQGMPPAEFVAWTQLSPGSPTYDGPPSAGQTGPGIFAPFHCNAVECAVEQGSLGEAPRELLVITGGATSTHAPEKVERWVCNAVLVDKNYTPGSTCRFDKVFRYGAPTIQLDLGGDDTYQGAVAMVGVNATLPVSLFLDVDGADRYSDPTPLYNALSPLVLDLGSAAGHPTQASALYGGVAVLLDAQGEDSYEAPTRSQGFGRLGLALLADVGTSQDQYRGLQYVQGASGDTFTLGAGILYDDNGRDRYFALTGQGYGLGGVLLDLGGIDRYTNDRDASGIPIVHLNVLPGGAVSSMNERADNRIWIDGPASLDPGIGIDQEIVLSGGSAGDQDGFPDLVEFLVGTNPKDTSDSPATNPAARGAALLLDTDGDGYPDYIERALSTDPANGASYPAGFPSNVAIVVPSTVLGAIPETVADLVGIDRQTGRVAPFDNDDPATGSNFTSSDKIVDLRLPLQNAGSVDYACTGQFFPNASAPLGLLPGQNIFMGAEESGSPAVDEDHNNAVTQQCAFVSYQSTSPGQGNGTIPLSSGQPDPFSFTLPAGILAIGDVVNTKYVDDYFVVIDLGGRDRFFGSPGGALLVQTVPHPIEGTSNTGANVNNVFLAPSLVVNVDVSATTAGVVEAGDPSSDRYENASRDFSSGAFFGVLVDTAGNDFYTARNASQGVLGGVLLDLAGSDTYVAQNLTQGAGLAATPAGAVTSSTGVQTRPIPDMPGGGELPADSHGGATGQSYNAERRMVPGILLDIGDADLDRFTAWSHSQGFARGFPGSSPQTGRAAPSAQGILANLGTGSDIYTSKGRNSQGVGGVDGVGLLFDADGIDSYSAMSPVSQGATISQLVNTSDAALNQQPHLAAGLLVDLNGKDSFKLNSRTHPERINNELRITRSESAFGTTNGVSNNHLFADVGLHFDTEFTKEDPRGLLMGLGNGTADPLDNNDFYVDLPAARIAIGKETPNVYEREYAFVVDLGGANTYKHSAGGLIRDHLAQSDPGSDQTSTALPNSPYGAVPGTSAYGGALSLFPVTLVLDAGRNASSSYQTSAPFSQGAGLFSVGILADLGGRDTITALGTSGESASSQWIRSDSDAFGANLPVIDATISGDWEGNAGRTITLRAQRDGQFTSPWNLRVANDEHSIYLALTGRTNSATPTDLAKDVLILDLDMGHRGEPWDFAANRTGIDQVYVYYDPASGACTAKDRAYNDSFWLTPQRREFSDDRVSTQTLQVACRYTSDGEVTYEIKKDLQVGFPYDSFDLGYCYDDVVGFGYATNATAASGRPSCEFPADQIGLYLQFNDTGAGYNGVQQCASGNCAAPFSWPAGAVDQDGAFGHVRNANLSDEMREWATIGLAQVETNGIAPANVRKAELSQGVGIAGIGIVAMLGTQGGDSQYKAGDRSLGYASFGGLGAVIDSVGSDLYEAGDKTLAAAELRSFGLLIDVQGNDNYHAAGKSLAWSPAVSGTGMIDGATSVFLDLSGDDEYLRAPIANTTVDALRNAQGDPDPTAIPNPPGNNVVWIQNQSVGADYRIVDRVRDALATSIVKSLYNLTGTNLTLNVYDPVAPGPWGNHCTDTPYPYVSDYTPTDRPDYVVRGKVCFLATVNSSNMPGPFTTATTAACPTAQTVGESVTAALVAVNGGEVAPCGVVNVDSVDFMVDRQRVASSYARRNVTDMPWITQWTAPVDLSTFEDGVSRARALPLFTADLGPLGTFLFFDAMVDRTADDNINTLSSRTLVINNAPEPAVKLGPAYTGVANATYSSVAYGQNQVLTVDYTVSHDVGEDRYAQYNSWRTPTYNSSFPCHGIPDPKDERAVLCDEIPFYLDTDGIELTTTPGTDPQETFRNIQPEFFDHEDSPYSASMPKLRTGLDIVRTDSFHLHLQRQALHPTNNYTTIMRLLVYNATGQNVQTADGQVWHLADLNKTAPAATPTPGQLGGLFGTASAAFNSAVATASNTATGLLQGENQVSTVVALAYNRTCTNTSAQCDQTSGRIGTGAFSVCAKNPPTGNAIAKAVYDAFQSVNNATAPTISGPTGGYQLCGSMWPFLNRTADDVGGNGDTGLGSIVKTVADGALGAVDQVVGIVNSAGLGESFAGSGDAQRVGGVNLTDFWFNVTPQTALKTSTSCAYKDGQPVDCIRWEGDVLHIPAGFQVKMEMYLDTTESELTKSLGETWKSIFDGVADNITFAADTVLDASGGAVNPYTPVASNPGLNPINNTIEKALRDSANRPPFAPIDSLGLPAGFFTVKAGPEAQQSRLAVRVPSESSTRVEVTIDDRLGNTAATLASGLSLDGDVAGSPTRLPELDQNGWWESAHESPQPNWSRTPVNASTRNAPRWTQHHIDYTGADLRDDLYYVTVRAKDGASNEAVARDTVLIDSTPPQTFVTTATFAGKAILRGSAIPVQWGAIDVSSNQESIVKQGSGLLETYLYVRNGTAGDITDPSTWENAGAPRGPYPPGVRSEFPTKNPQSSTYLFLTLGVDRAGNVEGATSTLDDPITSKEAALAKGFATKLARGANVLGGYTSVFVDEGNPRFSSLKLDGGRLVNYQGSEFTFVRAGQALTFGACVRDAESDVAYVNLSFDHVEPATGALSSATFTMSRQGPCDTTGTLFTSSEWSSVNENATRFPEGVWIAMLTVFDNAGNQLRVPAGNVILDHAAPTVHLQDPILPAGQSAVKPGDVVKIRLIAEDNFGVDESRITVDASALAKNASALKTRSVRVNGIIYQEAVFTVDKPDVTNKIYEVKVRVPDFADNATIVVAHVAVDFKPFEFVAGTLRASNITHNGLTLHWKTTEPTSALAKYGPSAVSLTGRTPQDLNATLDHAFRVEGLQPSTHYVLRAVAVSAGGTTKESETIEIDTASALFLTPVFPVSGDRVSGMVPIRFKGGLLDSSDFVSYTLEVRDGPTKPWTFVTTATRQGELHTLNWNSTRFLDGPGYELRLTAEAGRDTLTRAISRITSDNTPPSVLVLTPLLATNDTTPDLTAEGSDGLAGLVESPPTLLVDGVEVPGAVRVEPLAGGRLRFTHAFNESLAAGMRSFELRVADRAGNVAREQWKVAIDGDAPVVSVNPTHYAPGTIAAKRGGTATLNLTIKDLSGVASVVANASALNAGMNELRLVKLVNTDLWHGTIVVTASDASATMEIPIVATDLAGNVQTLVVRVPVDNVAPELRATRTIDIRHQNATIEVPANEPILVSGTATAPLSPPVTAATIEATKTAKLVLNGLLPSRTYQFKLAAMDGAGNQVDLAGSFATLEDKVAPSAVGQITVVDLLNGTLHFTWAPAHDDVLVSHYRVYRSDDGVTFRQIAEPGAAAFDDSGLPYEKSYVYKVAAVDYGANEGPAEQRIRAAATAVPRLSAAIVTPTVGSVSTLFRYTVTYLSPGGVPPAYVRVILDGVPQNMSLSQGGDVSTGAVYVYETRLAPHKRDAPHTYAFEASDGRYTVRFPEDGSVQRGPLVSGDASAAADQVGLAAFAQRVPLGGVAGVGLALVAAVGIASVLRRKTKGGSK